MQFTQWKRQGWCDINVISGAFCAICKFINCVIPFTWAEDLSQEKTSLPCKEVRSAHTIPSPDLPHQWDYPWYDVVYCVIPPNCIHRMQKVSFQVNTVSLVKQNKGLVGVQNFCTVFSWCQLWSKMWDLIAFRLFVDDVNIPLGELWLLWCCTFQHPGLKIGASRQF